LVGSGPATVHDRPREPIVFGSDWRATGARIVARRENEPDRRILPPRCPGGKLPGWRLSKMKMCSTAASLTPPAGRGAPAVEHLARSGKIAAVHKIGKRMSCRRRSRSPQCGQAGEHGLGLGVVSVRRLAAVAAVPMEDRLRGRAACVSEGGLALRAARRARRRCPRPRSRCVRLPPPAARPLRKRAAPARPALRRR
jgi:hypothetical protein